MKYLFDCQLPIENQLKNSRLLICTLLLYKYFFPIDCSYVYNFFAITEIFRGTI